MGFTERCNRRLQREIMDLLNKSATETSSCGICFELPDEKDITKLTAYLQGPQNTPYEKGIFQLSINFQSDYPMSPPKIKFNTRIWHPNISSVTGAVCLNTLSVDWTPSLSVFACLLSIRTLLLEPAPDDPQDSMVAKQYNNNILNFIATAKYWTNEFASKHDNYECLDLKLARQILDDKNPEELDLLEHYKFLHEKIVAHKISRTKALEVLCLVNWDLENAMEQLNIKFDSVEKEENILPVMRPSGSSSRKVSIPRAIQNANKKSLKNKLGVKAVTKKTTVKNSTVKKSTVTKSTVKKSTVTKSTVKKSTTKPKVTKRK